jgi:chemosensory pili system protein ChpA (sensor histidine kinase/response regulator)
LQRNNHTTVTMDNGRDALTFLADADVDLVVTDVNMPEMSGLTLLEQLRSNARTRDLPVIIRTASIEERVHQVASENGASGFLTQPTSSWELKELVNRCLTSE